MNAPLRHALNLDRSFWTVIVPGDDPVTVTSWAEMDLVVRSLPPRGRLTVCEFNLAEGWANDVTDEFVRDDDDAPDYPTDDRECSRADTAVRLAKEGVW